MPAPSSIMSLPDARAFLNKAIESEKGARAKFITRRQAEALRFRCYTARKRERELFLKMHPDAEIAFSAWDKLSLTIKSSEELGEGPGFFYLYAVHDEDFALGMIQTEEL